MGWTRAVGCVCVDTQHFLTTSIALLMQAGVLPDSRGSRTEMQPDSYGLEAQVNPLIKNTLATRLNMDFQNLTLQQSVWHKEFPCYASCFSGHFL